MTLRTRNGCVLRLAGAAQPFSEPRRPLFLIYELRRLVLVAMAAAAVRFSTPSLA